MTQLANAQAEVNALETQVSDLQAGNGAASVPEATEADITLSTEGQTGRTLYRIDQRDSRATFTLMETLQGTRTTVIGGTNDVAGDVIIDFENPLQSQVGTIRINARTFVTPEEMRNRALRAEILLSSRDEFEFIEFVPTELNGLPESVTVGETYSFEIIGNLTIINTTNPVTFATTVTIDSEDVISGTATVTVLYADWGITIPDAVGVADVTDDVTLAIEFIARAVE
jgi:polyisoprenoid-binding protein YceI